MTSRLPDSTEESSLSDYRVSLPSDATSQEAAAIVTAIDSHLRETIRSNRAETKSWQGNRWAFAGRIEAIGGPPIRVPTNAPTDPWTAAGRIPRY